jgi:hypothetical protein
MDRELVRLVADRMCYLERGTDGLRWRHGMYRADRHYRDHYDLMAERYLEAHPPQPKAQPQPVGWKQLTLLEA